MLWKGAVSARITSTFRLCINSSKISFKCGNKKCSFHIMKTLLNSSIGIEIYLSADSLSPRRSV